MRHDPGGVLPGHVVRRREVKTIGEFEGGLGRAWLANRQRGGRRLGIRRDVGGGRDLQFQAFPIEQSFDGDGMRVPVARETPGGFGRPCARPRRRPVAARRKRAKNSRRTTSVAGWFSARCRLT